MVVHCPQHHFHFYPPPVLKKKVLAPYTRARTKTKDAEMRGSPIPPIRCIWTPIQPLSLIKNDAALNKRERLCCFRTNATGVEVRLMAPHRSSERANWMTHLPNNGLQWFRRHLGFSSCFRMHCISKAVLCSTSCSLSMVFRRMTVPLPSTTTRSSRQLLSRLKAHRELWADDDENLYLRACPLECHRG